jgi:hypothetical protein
VCVRASTKSLLIDLPHVLSSDFGTHTAGTTVVRDRCVEAVSKRDRCVEAVSKRNTCLEVVSTPEPRRKRREALLSQAGNAAEHLRLQELRL